MVHSKLSRARKIVAVITAQCFLGSNIVLAAGQIVTDGNTRTALDVRGSVTEVTTSTIYGRNAFNSFLKFDVYQGNVVNLRVPASAANLLNLVHDKATQIDGTLNAYKNGMIGGNVFFANPHGIVVGKGGVVNVGSLSASTPTKAFMQGFFRTPGEPSLEAAAQLINGTVPLNGSATISIEGRINSQGDIQLHGGQVILAGSLQAGLGRATNEMGFEDIVNTQGLESGVELVERDGEILILGEGDVGISGELIADGAQGKVAGAITVQAGQDLHIAPSARLSASGQGEDSGGGRVDLYANRDAIFSDGAMIAAAGGDSGDGGFVELSAKAKVDLAGGRFNVGAPGGEGGSVLIDPNEITVSSNNIVEGGDISLEADESITVEENVVISSRDLDGSSEYEEAVSKGDSGDISLEAPSITLKPGSKLLAHAIADSQTPDPKAGDIFLTASMEDHPGLTIADANSIIIVDGAILKGGNITLTSTADALYDWGGTTDDIVIGLIPTFIEGVATILAGVNVGLAIARGSSEVTVKGGSLLEAEGNVTLSAQTNSSANTYRIVSAGALTGEVFGLGFIYGETKAHATVDVESGATIKATDLVLDARNTTELNVNVYAFSTGDSVEAAVALTHSDVSSEAQIGLGADIQVSDSVSVSALNNNSLSSNAKAMALGAGKAGVAATIFTANNRANASVDADLLQTTGVDNLVVQALDNNVKNSAKASASTGSGFIAKKITAPLINYTVGKANEYIRSWLGKGKEPDARSNATSKPKLAGALTYVDSQQTANASIGAGARIEVDKSVVVDARVVDKFLKVQAASSVKSEARSPTAENPQATTALSLAVNYGNYRHTADAHIGDGAQIRAQHVGVGSDVIVPWDIVFKKWEGLSTVLNSLGDSLDFENELLTSFSKAVSKAEEVNLAGVVNILDFTNQSRAYLGKEAAITLLPGGMSDWSQSLAAATQDLGWGTTDREWDAPVAILASNWMAGGFSAGNVALTLFGTGAGDEGTSVGAAYNQVNYDSTTLAYIAEGASIVSSDGSNDFDLLIRAESSENLFSLAPTAGKGGSYGLNGVFSLASISNTTEASIDDEATVAARNIRLEAEDEMISWSLSGAVNKAESAAIGIGVAVADITTNTSAFVGDNDNYYMTEQNPTGSTLALTDGSVTAADLDVAARTDGRIETIAVAGSFSSSSDPVQPTTRPSSIAVVEDTRSKWQKAISWLKGKFSSGGVSTQTEPKYGLGISGAVAWNDVELNTNAYVAIPKVTIGNGGLEVTAVNDTDIGAFSGSASLVRANAKSSKRSAGFAGALAVNNLDNDTFAYLKDTEVIDAADTQILALAGGEQLAIAIGASVNTSAEQAKAASAAGSVSVSMTDNRVVAYVENSTVTGDNSGAFNLIAYDRTRLGTGGGSLTAGGRGGFGAAITYSDIDNTVEAYLSGTTLNNYQTARIEALSSVRIAAGGAMLGLTNDQAKGTLGGAIVISEIDNTTRAGIRNASDITLDQSLLVLARDTEPVAELDEIVDARDEGNPNSASVDYDGTEVGEDPNPGSSMLSVAGVVQVGASNIGISFTRSTISNEFTASVDDSNVSVPMGAVDVQAYSGSRINSYAVGVGFATDEFAGAGSVTLNEVNNQVSATVDLSPGNTLESKALNVRAEDQSRIGSLAGQVTISQGSTAIGAAVAHNEIGNTLTARISGAALNAQDDTGIEALNSSIIRTLSATAGGAEDFAFNGAGSHAHIANTTEAELRDSEADNSEQIITVEAQDDSTIESISGGAAIATSGTGVGAAVAVNRISNTTKAHISGVAENKVYHLKNLQVRAGSEARIKTVAVALGGGKATGFGGSVVTNFVDNDTLAYIDDGAEVVVENNLGVLAESDDWITMAAGSAGIGLTVAGVGASVSVNRISGDTKAYIEGNGTRVTAKGVDSSDTLTIFKGELDEEVDLASSIDIGSYNSLDLKDKKQTEEVTGIAVIASATQHVENINVNVAGSKVFAGGVTVNVNLISGETRAFIDQATVNALASGSDHQNLNVTASNHAYGNGFVGTLAVSGGTSIGAATDIHSIDRTTSAYITDSSILNTDDIRVKALATQGVSSAAIGGAAGIGGGAFAGTGAVAKFAGTTEAYLERSNVTADTLQVLADSSNNMHLVGGALSVAGGFGVAGTFALGISDTTTRAYVAGEDETHAFLDIDGQVKIDAVTDNNFKSYAVGGALAGGTGLAGAVTVNLVTNTTEAWLQNADVGTENDRVGSLEISAANTVNIKNSAGALGIGLSGLGLGAGANINILKSRVTSGIEQSRVYSKQAVSVSADSSNVIGGEAIMAGVGGTFGIGGAAVVVLVGDDLKDAAASELDSGGDGTLTHMQASMDGTDLDAIDSDDEAVLSATEREEMESSARQQVSQVAYGEEAERYRYQTAARITGSDTFIDSGGDIEVSATDSSQVDVMAMGIGVSAGVGIGGAVGIVKLKGKSNAYVNNAAMTAVGDIAITASGKVENTDVTTYAGGAGIIGLGAAYSEVDSTPHTSAYLGPQTEIRNADNLVITAYSSSDINAEGKGLVAGAVAVGVVIAEASDEGNTYAYIDAGASVGTDSGAGQVGSLRIEVTADQTLVADTGAAAGGIVAGQGSLATVNANPTVRAFTGDGTDIAVREDLAIVANTVIDGSAVAKGITVAGAGAGVSLATANANPDIHSSVGQSSRIHAGNDISVTAHQMTEELSSAATASFGGLIGVAASNATTDLTPTVKALVGEGTVLTSDSGEILLLADADNMTTATSDGWVGAVAAWGSNAANARITDAVTEAGFGRSVSAAADSIIIRANAVNDAYASSTAGAGGVVVGASADASTRIDSETRAFVADNDADNTAVLSAANDLVIAADELSIFNSQSDSTAGGVVGYSGADVDDDVDALVTASIGLNTNIESGRDLFVQALNRTQKGNVGRNASAGAGGVLGLSAGDGGTTIDNTVQALVMGNNEDTDHLITAGGAINITADNDVNSYSYGKLSAGGLIANADIEMESTSNNTALASIGENAALNAGEDLNLRSRSDADVETIAHTSTWGVSASGTARAKTWIDNSNASLVAANARLTAGRDINIAAGLGLDGFQNSLRGRAEGRSWAKGLFPSGSVTGWSTVDNSNGVDVAAGSSLRSGRDSNLGSYAGSVISDGYAKAKKTSYLFFGIPINLYSNGSRRSDQNSTTTVNVDGVVESGLNHHRWINVGFDGEVDGNIGYTSAAVDLREKLDAEIAQLETQIANETTDLKVALENKKQRLEQKRDSLPADAVIDRIAIDDTLAESGSINIFGVLSGSGTLKAPGNDLSITVRNDSPAHIVTNHLEIPLTSKGDITLNGKRIISHPGMGIEYGKNAQPQIFIASYYNHDTGPVGIPTEIRLNGNLGYGGDIINLAGSVVITNQFGDVTSSAKIIADSVDIDLGGTFVHEYTPGVHLAENVIAGNNISISAEVINLNGILQSGIPYRTVMINPFTDDDIEEMGGEKVIRPDALCGAIECNIRAVWDEEKQLIKVDPVRFGGGNIELFGEIASTGGGEIRLFDGFGEINIINNTDHDILLRSLNIGERVVGKARIFDTGKVYNESMVLTEITADGVDKYYRSEQDGHSVWNLYESTVVDNRVDSYSYSPRPGLRYLEYYDLTFTNKPVTPTSTHWWSSFGVENDSSIIGLLSNITNVILDNGIKGADSQLIESTLADSSIPVEFIGRTDQGVISVRNTGQSDTWLNGAIRNVSGNVDIISDNGDILASHDYALIAAREINLSAIKGEIGSGHQDINLDLGAGVLTAVAGGLVNLDELDGDLIIRLLATEGNVMVRADGSIESETPGIRSVTGNDITLISINGGIGSAGNDFIIDSGGVLAAEAKESIFLTEQLGDMHVNKIVSLNGDVVLVSNGAIEDYNFFEELDQDVKEKLVNIWKEMELQNEDRIGISITQYKAQKRAEYQDAHRISDNGTTGYTEDDTFDSSYDPNYEYQLTADEQRNFSDAVWTDEQLLITKNVLTIPESANDGTLRVKTEVLIEDPNVQAGGNVVLRAKTGIGEHLGDILVTQESIDAGTVTQEQKLQIIAAERDDLTYEEENRQLRVSKKRDFDIAAAGSIDIQARDFIFLGSETDINISKADSQSSDIRLKVNGNIFNANDNLSQANLLADDLIIEASAKQVAGVDLGGNIGAMERPLVVDLRPGGILTPRADGDIYLTELDGDMQIDQLLSGGRVVLRVEQGDFLADTLYNQGGSFNVQVMGNRLMIHKLLEPASVNLAVAEEGGSASVDELTLSSYLKVNADNILLPNVQHSSSSKTLHVSLTGNDGGLGDTQEIKIHSSGRVIFDDMGSEEFDLEFDSDLVEFDRLQVGEWGSILTPTHYVIVDNLDRVLQEGATTQLFAPDQAFSLKLTGERLLYTSAYIINYDPNYIVNNFSTENSVTRIQPKRNTLSDNTNREFEQGRNLDLSIELAELMDGILMNAAGGLVSFNQDQLFIEEEEADEASDLQIVE